MGCLASGNGKANPKHHYFKKTKYHGGNKWLIKLKCLLWALKLKKRNF